MKIKLGDKVRVKENDKIGEVVTVYFWGQFCVWFEDKTQAWFNEEDNKVEIIKRRDDYER